MAGPSPLAQSRIGPMCLPTARLRNLMVRKNRMLAKAASTIHLEAMPMPRTVPSASKESIRSEQDAGESREHDPLGGDADAEDCPQREQGKYRTSTRAALDMDQEEEVRQHDEEDRKDVDHADARLDEEHAVETDKSRGGDREKAVRPQSPREEEHHRHAQDSEDAGGDPPAEGVETQVDVVARGALEVRAIPAVAPLPRRDEQLGEGRLRIEVVEPAADRGRPAELDSLDVVVGVDRKVDLVENLAVGRRQDAVLIRVTTIEGIGEPA